MRPIDAEELTKILKSLFFKGQLHHHYDAEKCAYNGALSDAIERIRNAPTIDPAKHGQWDWLQYDENNPKNGNWYCSKCNMLSLNKSLYCPRCGARMDGEENEEKERT